MTIDVPLIRVKDYKFNAGRINWINYLIDDEHEPVDLYYIKFHENDYCFFCKSKADAAYLKIRFPERFI